MQEDKAERLDKRILIARILVIAVFVMNVSCAIQFIAQPEAFVHAYELTGPGAEAAIVGFGIAFLMWNATYPPLIANPTKYGVLFGVVLVQQILGLIGETILRFTLPPEMTVLASSLLRFMVFDAVGLVALVAAFMVSREKLQRY